MQNAKNLTRESRWVKKKNTLNDIAATTPINFPPTQNSK